MQQLNNPPPGAKAFATHAEDCSMNYGLEIAMEDNYGTMHLLTTLAQILKQSCVPYGRTSILIEIQGLELETMTNIVVHSHCNN